VAVSDFADIVYVGSFGNDSLWLDYLMDVPATMSGGPSDDE
jgi:hypothetical protein